MTIDLNSLSSRHLGMILNETLLRDGMNASVVHGEKVNNEFAQIKGSEIVYPDPPNQEPVFFKVLLGAPYEGLLIEEDVISYSDKVQTQFKLISKVKLELNDKVSITMTDDKVMNLRVIEPPITTHSYKTTFFTSIGVVI